MPIRSNAPSEGDTYSLMSQATTTMTIGDSLPAQLVRKSARKGFTFNIMSVGPPGLGQTTVLSALFGKSLEIGKQEKGLTGGDPPHFTELLNPPISIDSKQFEIDDKGVRLRLTLVECKNYGEALCLKDTHKPLVDYIDLQFAEYHKRESGFDRRSIQDKMIHCLFFFISPLRHRLSKLDLEFLRSVHRRVNIVLVVAKAEALTLSERIAFKQRIKDDLEKYHIQVYEMPDPVPEDSDDTKRLIKDIQDSMPFAVSSMKLRPDNTPIDRDLAWAKLDPFDQEHSDFLLLKTMLHMQMPELLDSTHEVFYEEYRLRKNSN